jgi:hypothetical protein
LSLFPRSSTADYDIIFDVQIVNQSTNSPTLSKIATLTENQP